jgi:hypothetical protein
VIALATIAFNRPHMISEQIRLLGKYLEDDYVYAVFDQSSDEQAAEEIRAITVDGGGVYIGLRSRMHHEGLNTAARELLLPSDECGLVLPFADAPYVGFLDHDIFPTGPTSLVSFIEPVGFYGVGQRHPATGRLYLWPGFCFFSRDWLAGRPLDFSGLHDGDKRNDGDTGSSLWPLFVEEDWQKLYRVEHSYQAIRRPDEYGLQSWGVERIGDWLHTSNASNWMAVPDPQERERLILELLVAL